MLHPRLLVVHKFSKPASDQDTDMKMEKVYQHKLERSAANMVCGPFGGVRGIVKVRRVSFGFARCIYIFFLWFIDKF